MTSTERRHAKNRRLVAEWTHPAGTPVTVERANGKRLKTWTETTAFLLEDSHAFVRVRGIPGNTRLGRVKVRKK